LCVADDAIANRVGPVGCLLKALHEPFEQEAHVGLQRGVRDRRAEIFRRDHCDRQALSLFDDDVDRRTALDDELCRRVSRETLRKVDLKLVVMQAGAVQHAAAVAKPHRVPAGARTDRARLGLERVAELGQPAA
jgi:hypothetical protein